MIVLDVQGKKRIKAEHSIRVGRDAEWANLPLLDEDQISRHHLEIRPDEGGYRVWDLGSTNGTSVNGRMVGDGGSPLAEGDVILAGGVIDLRVVSVTETDAPPATKLGPAGTAMTVELHVDVFVVNYQIGGRTIRDTMAYQLGLALSMLAQYQLDGMGSVPDVDLRSFVWRGDRDQMQHGDINRLLLRVRKWFTQRGEEPPTIVRPKRAGSTRLDMPASSLTVLPEGWLYRFLDNS